ncbi:MAG: polyprenyl synthetase family protein [Melioribacteraceae bacterium]|nr:polyprenyl synthetase family protein [Melioribacteraceae bacterium]
MKKNITEKYSLNYSNVTKKIDEKLSKILEAKTPKSLYEPCSYILQSGGKHLRSYLVLLTTKAVGGKISKAYNAALSVEVLHSFTLVHDDIMDSADKRRGRETLHIKYDISTAILAGDSLIAVAYKYLLKDSKVNTLNILNTFNQSVLDVCEGQSLDKEFEVRGDVTIQEYTKMIQKKTAALIEMCCSIGAQIGGGNRNEIKALEIYGRNIGLAFQLKDDLLDIMGDEKDFGKNVGGDLVEGKKTFLFLKALEIAEGNDKLELLKVVKNSGIRKNQIKKYKKLYEKLNILEITEKEINRYTNLALKSLNKIKDSDAKENLRWLANSLIDRNK